MSQDSSNPEQELQKREQELKERELSLRIRELEVELQDKQKSQDAESTSSNKTPAPKRSSRLSLTTWINLIGFCLLGLAIAILTVQYRGLIIFFLILAFLGFVAYKLFWEKP
jgi:F0F1-type ATP synthase assembly protein I